MSKGRINMYDKIRFIGINKDSTTAGPGKRLEFFTKGCIRGVISPCEGCFNESTWTFEGLYRELTIDEVVEICDRDAWNRQVTFCGGEPMLQAKAIAKVAKRLKEIDPTFYIVMYTAYKLDTLMKYGLKFTWIPKYGDAMRNHLMDYAYAYSREINRTQFILLSPDDVKELMAYVDLIVDGDYQQDKRLTTDQYMHDGWFIGSANQRVIHTQKTLERHELVFVYADVYNRQYSIAKHCKCCGHSLPNDDIDFCNEQCEKRYNQHILETAWLKGDR